MGLFTKNKEKVVAQEEKVVKHDLKIVHKGEKHLKHDEKEEIKLEHLTIKHLTKIKIHLDSMNDKLKKNNFTFDEDEAEEIEQEDGDEILRYTQKLLVEVATLADRGKDSNAIIEETKQYLINEGNIEKDLKVQNKIREELEKLNQIESKELEILKTIYEQIEPNATIIKNKTSLVNDLINEMGANGKATEAEINQYNNFQKEIKNAVDNISQAEKQLKEITKKVVKLTRSVKKINKKVENKIEDIEKEREKLAEYQGGVEDPNAGSLRRTG